MTLLIMRMRAQRALASLTVLLLRVILLTPSFAENTVSEVVYLNMLETTQIEDVNLIFQSNGALPHYLNIVFDYLDEKFPHLEEMMKGFTTTLN